MIRSNQKSKFVVGWLFCLLSIFGVGCGTTTNRLATEQLLMSDAVDRAIAEIDFRSLSGRTVFLDTLFLHSVKGVGFVNSEYIISSLRQQLTAANCRVQDSRDTAEVIVEPRVGALGTDGHEVVYGLPQTGALNSAAAILSSSPVPPIPELSLGKSNAQSGIAKILVYAYDRETRDPIWQSGIAKAESTSRDTWFLGAGPFQKGSIHDGIRFAGKDIPENLPPPHQAFNFPRRQSAKQAQENIAKRQESSQGNSQGISQGISLYDSHTFQDPFDGLDGSEVTAADKPDQAESISPNAKRLLPNDDMIQDEKLQAASHEEATANK